MVGIVAVAATLATVSGPSNIAQRCANHGTPATIGGRIVCLSPVAPCRARHQKRYRKYGFRCSDGSLEYDWSASPAYPTLSVRSDRAAVVMVWPPTEPPYLGWAGTKVLWTVPLYTGAVLVRGRQLDGPNRVGFDLGPGWTNRVLPEIRLIGPEEGLHPAATFTRTPGCYAYQVDTLRSSYRIVFDAQLGYR
jgi:hypothetical protein